MRLTDGDYMRMLQTAVQTGLAALCENIQESCMPHRAMCRAASACTPASHAHHHKLSAEPMRACPHLTGEY